jgi:hypothetical protein
MPSNNYIYKMSNAGGMSTVTRYTDMLAGNTTWNPWEPAGAYDALATVTVPSGGAASIEFAGIPTGYKHLQIRGLGRASSGNAYMKVRFNSDAGNNYTYHQLFGLGSGSAAAGGGTSENGAAAITVTAGSLAANIFAVSIIDVLDYANTSKNKTLRCLDGMDANGSGQIILNSGLWLNTSAITSVSLIISASTFAQHSTFALYGIK